MGAVIKTKLVRIGNSQGIRTPRVVVEQAGLQGELELEVRRKQVVLRPASHPRQGNGLRPQQPVEAQRMPQAS